MELEGPRIRTGSHSSDFPSTSAIENYDNDLLNINNSDEEFHPLVQSEANQVGLQSASQNPKAIRQDGVLGQDQAQRPAASGAVFQPDLDGTIDRLEYLNCTPSPPGHESWRQHGGPKMPGLKAREMPGFNPENQWGTVSAEREKSWRKYYNDLSASDLRRFKIGFDILRRRLADNCDPAELAEIWSTAETMTGGRAAMEYLDLAVKHKKAERLLRQKQEKEMEALQNTLPRRGSEGSANTVRRLKKMASSLRLSGEQVKQVGALFGFTKKSES